MAMSTFLAILVSRGKTLFCRIPFLGHHHASAVNSLHSACQMGKRRRALKSYLRILDWLGKRRENSNHSLCTIRKGKVSSSCCCCKVVKPDSEIA
jgi:hypothetical protein